MKEVYAIRRLCSFSIEILQKVVYKSYPTNKRKKYHKIRENNKNYNTQTNKLERTFCLIIKSM